MITIVDYGMGNLRSVQKALEKLGFDADIADAPAGLANADKLILPGVGAFRDAIRQLEQQGFVEPIRRHVEAGRPMLGICLGLQLLFDTSHEDGRWTGLGLVPGEVVRFDDAPGLKIPHMGWNQLEPVGSPRLLAGIPAGAYFYFVHSYHVVPTDPAVVAARTEHGYRFVSVIERDNLFATQFHPEKSQAVGLRLLRNFAEM
jgi:glutamine amidotransferase